MKCKPKTNCSRMSRIACCLLVLSLIAGYAELAKGFLQGGEIPPHTKVRRGPQSQDGTSTPKPPLP